jgi:hypothetical protein
MEKLGNALILSPFATHPLDAGQRKRAFQTTKLLKEWGFSITFLHFAFETRWYWGHNSEDDAVLKEQWEGDILHFYANKKVGQPPINGESHQLDEWWDETLGGYITNILSKRQFDLFVVHNIWLSKAFDYVPNHCMKVLEMHDLFSKRAREFDATGISPEFFHCTEKDEVFGLKRADLLLAIKHEDAEWCKERDLGKTQVITVPYSEQSDTDYSEALAGTTLKPLPHGKIVFGMIGSDIHFNRYAVHTLIKELEVAIRETYAPIEFVLAGSICRSIGECPAFVKKLGFVDQISDFYASIDIIMVPMLHGTGVKIKSIEALTHHLPVLFTAHSAEGTGYNGHTCKTIREMALWAAQIATERIIPNALVKDCQAALNRSRGWIEEAKQKFLFYYNQKRPSFIQLLGTNSPSLPRIIFETFSGLGLHKELASKFRSQGICIQPELSQYVASIPSQSIHEIQSMQTLMESWEYSTFAVISFDHYQVLNILSSCNGPRLVFLDCRFTSPENLSTLKSLDNFNQQEIVCLLTPIQRSFLDETFKVKTIVYPVLTERSTWDPHLTPLYKEVKKNTSQIAYRNNLEVNIEAKAFDSEYCNFSEEIDFSYDPRAVLHEAMIEIKLLCLQAAKMHNA